LFVVEGVSGQWWWCNNDCSTSLLHHLGQSHYSCWWNRSGCYWVSLIQHGWSDEDPSFFVNAMSAFFIVHIASLDILACGHTVARLLTVFIHQKVCFPSAVHLHSPHTWLTAPFSLLSIYFV
jgi:hypothetical protein